MYYVYYSIGYEYNSNKGLKIFSTEKEVLAFIKEKVKDDENLTFENFTVIRGQEIEIKPLAALPIPDSSLIKDYLMLYKF